MSRRRGPGHQALDMSKTEMRTQLQMSRRRGPGHQALDMSKTEMRTQLQKRVDNMSPEMLRELVMKLVERDPFLTSYILEYGGINPPRTTPKWCLCKNCEEMPKVEERKCCGKIPELCVSKQTEMDKLVLDPEVLSIGDVCQAHLLEMLSVKKDVRNRCMRQAAYRNFTLWEEGRLGKLNRKPVPSCCVWKIRDKFPDSNKRYTGFYGNRFASKTLSYRE